MTSVRSAADWRGAHRPSCSLPMRRSLVVILLALPLGVAACDAAAPATQRHDPPGDEVTFAPGSPRLAQITVDTVRIRRSRVVAVLPAQVALDEDHAVRVTSPVTGRIATINVAAGDHVTPGAPLASIVSSDVALARSEWQRAEAALTLAVSALARTRDLFDHRVVALRDLQQAIADSTQARAERDRALAALQRLGTTNPTVGSDYVLRAPLGGEITARPANPGMEVRPDLADPLFTIADLDTLWITASVYERDLAAVRRGQRVVFTSDALPGRRIEAAIVYVSQALDPATRTATLRAVVPNRGHDLRPGMFGEARVIAFDTTGVPTVPTTALVTRGAETIVLVQVTPGHFVARPVRVGADDGEVAVILEGLRVGELIVTRGSVLVAGEIVSGR